MKVEFCSNDKGYEDVIEMLNENHPEYRTKITHEMDYCKSSEENLVAKVGGEYLEASTPKELYDKITDHYFQIPHCFIG